MTTPGTNTIGSPQPRTASNQGSDPPASHQGDVVERIELWPVHVPFTEQVRAAMRSGGGHLGMAIAAEEPWTGGDGVVCRLTSASGHTGLGEAFIWLPESGVSPTMIIAMIREALGKYVLGNSPFATEALRRRMNINVMHSETAKGILDMACYDLMGQIIDRPAHTLFGGACVAAVPMAALIPLSDPDRMVEFCQYFFALGYRTFRIKLGAGVEADRHIIAQIREEFSDVRLRVDYNQAYRVEEAVRAIQGIEPFGIDCAEQPVDATSFVAMAEVQRRVQTPLMAHEGCFGLRDIVTLEAMGAIRIVGVNAERPGGVTDLLRAISYAELRSLGVVMHNQPFGISAAMQIHVAAARFYALGHAIELFGHIMLEDDLVLRSPDFAGGMAHVPPGPGWGVTLDEEAVERYATEPVVSLVAKSAGN